MHPRGAVDPARCWPTPPRSAVSACAPWR
jgi:hypothetical protein